jgi:hypothetical protein
MRTATTYGFRASHPATLCQSIEILARFTSADLTYDLDSEAFLAYFRARRGLMILTGTPEEIAAQRAAFYSSSPSTDLYHHLTRAQLQDTWEIWTSTRAPEPAQTPLPTGQLTLF